MKKRLVVFSLLTFLMFLLAGCGKSNEAKSSYDDTGEENYYEDEVYEDEYNSDDDYTNEESNDDTSSDSAAPLIEQFVGLEGYADILKYFKEFGYVYTTKRPDSEPTIWSFQYEMLGKETVDGVETEHVKVTMVEYNETKVTEFWYDDQWEAVKIIKPNGEEKTGLDAAFEGSSLTVFTQMYCNYLAVCLSIYSEDGTIDNMLYDDNGTTAETIDVGNGSISMDVTDIKVKIGDYNRRYGSIPMDGKKFVVLMESYGKESDAVEGLKMTRAIAR